MSQAIIDRSKAGATAFAILGAITFCHLLNDLMQALLPALFPMLKTGFSLNFGQIGLIALVFNVTASLLQPLVGHFTDRRPQPYSLPLSMACTLLGIVRWHSLPASTRYSLVRHCSGSATLSSIQNHRASPA